MTSTNLLTTLPSDILIHLFSLLSIPEILLFRQTSKHIHQLSKQPIVWINASNRDIISKSWPWPGQEEEEDVERATRHAWRLGRRWIDESLTTMIPQKQVRFATNTSTAISDVRFLDVGGKKMVLTVSKGIWSVLTLWSIGEDEAAKVAEWSPKGGLFTGLAINDDVEADDRLAVSVAKEGGHETVLLSITVSNEKQYSLIPTHRIPTPQGASPLRPLNFVGSVLALSDDISQTVILDWKSGKMAVLVEETEGEGAGNWKHNTPIQVVYTHRSITVVRARSISLFPEPEMACPPPPPNYTPLATHSFGWVDDIAIVPAAPNKTDFRILIRAESDNPWRSDQGSLDVYMLKLNPDEYDPLPYTFPPVYVSSLPTPRGSLRCMNLGLGRCGTAVWVSPTSSSAGSGSAGLGLVVDQGVVDGVVASLLDDDEGGGVTMGEGSIESRMFNVNGGNLVSEDGFDVDLYGIGIGLGTGFSIFNTTPPPPRTESLVAGVFPGPLSSKVRTRPVLVNDGSGWTAIDYDESGGRVVVGSGDGRVRVVWL